MQSLALLLCATHITQALSDTIPDAEDDGQHQFATATTGGAGAFPAVLLWAIIPLGLLCGLLGLLCLWWMIRQRQIPHHKSLLDLETLTPRGKGENRGQRKGDGVLGTPCCSFAGSPSDPHYLWGWPVDGRITPPPSPFPGCLCTCLSPAKEGFDKGSPKFLEYDTSGSPGSPRNPVHKSKEDHLPQLWLPPKDAGWSAAQGSPVAPVVDSESPSTPNKKRRWREGYLRVPQCWPTADALLSPAKTVSSGRCLVHGIVLDDSPGASPFKKRRWREGYLRVPQRWPAEECPQGAWRPKEEVLGTQPGEAAPKQEEGPWWTQASPEAEDAPGNLPDTNGDPFILSNVGNEPPTSPSARGAHSSEALSVQRSSPVSSRLSSVRLYISSFLTPRSPAPLVATPQCGSQHPHPAAVAPQTIAKRQPKPRRPKPTPKPWARRPSAPAPPPPAAHHIMQVEEEEEEDSCPRYQYTVWF
eukprot:GGOE01022645.1.p1 GENE.GGOE01022645.1~~GGOE01022645.1.p1  ORF type:complete len:471 (+),score=83.97 GGOE01022645.1:67-1479(+)